MHNTVTNPDKPCLGLRIAGQEAIRSREDIFGYLEGSGVDVDSHDLALIAGFDLRADVMFIDFITTPCVFFHTIARLPHCHCCTPMLARGNCIASLSMSLYFFTLMILLVLHAQQFFLSREGASAPQ
jgi:hypothetical protein